MEFKNALSQASDKDSVSPAKVDRKIRLTLDEFHDRGSVFIFVHRNMYALFTSTVAEVVETSI